MSFGPKKTLERINSVNFFMESNINLEQDYSSAEFQLEQISEAFPGSQKDIEKLKKSNNNNQNYIQNCQQSTDDISNSIYDSSYSNNSQQQQSSQKLPESSNEQKTEEQILIENIKKEFMDDLQNQKWKETDSKKQLKGYKVPTEQKGLVWTLGTGIIEGNIQDAIDLFQKLEQDMDKFKVINSYAKDIRIVKQINENISIRYTESSPPFGKNIYGFFLSCKEHDEENGVHSFYGTSTQKPHDVDIKDLEKKKDSLVFYDCFKIEKIQGEQKKFKLSYINKMDLGNEIPNWVCNRIRNNRALDTLKAISEYCQKLEKNRKKQQKK